VAPLPNTHKVCTPIKKRINKLNHKNGKRRCGEGIEE
jgi:hypothetical protein